MSMVGRKGTIITVFSTAYAVGKTLIAINMAAELAKNRHTVCLIDLDLQFGDVASALKLTPEKTIADAERSMREHPDDTVAAEYLTPFSSGGVSFDVMANPKLLEEAYNLDTTLIRDLVVQLQLEYDYLIIDTTSTFSALNLSLMDLSTVIDFIGIVDFIPTIKNMKRGSDALKELGYDDNKIRYVLNRSNARTRINVKDVEAILGHQFHYVIPNDFQTAAESIKTGVLSFRRLLTYRTRRIRITPVSVWAKQNGFMRILIKNGRPNGRPLKSLFTGRRRRLLTRVLVR